MATLKEFSIELDNGDTETVIQEDLQASQIFWSNCLISHCLEDRNKEVVYATHVDLMGNFIKNDSKN